MRDPNGAGEKPDDLGLHLRRHFRGALLHLPGRDVLDMRRNVPHVAERIQQRPGAVAVELVLHRPQELRPRGHRALDRGIDVAHIDMKMHARAAARLRAEKIQGPGMRITSAASSAFL